MGSFSSSDLFAIIVGLVLGGLYLFKDSIFSPKVKEAPVPARTLEPSADSRDFVAKLKQTVRIQMSPTVFHLLICIYRKSVSPFSMEIGRAHV